MRKCESPYIWIEIAHEVIPTYSHPGARLPRQIEDESVDRPQ